MINTKFWEDDYTSNLDPIEKLLFLYLITNTATNISGVYELPLKRIAVETGIDREMVENIIKRFSKDEKIFYEKGWVIVKNFIKHQNQKSPLVKKGIENELSNAPQDLLVKYGIDTLSHLNLIKSNLIKPNLTKPNTINSNTSVKKIAISTFEEFWNEYPAKKNKKKAKEKWLKLKPALHKKIIADIKERNLKDRQWLQGYIPHPTTYLNGERWEDEIDTRIISNGKEKSVTILD